MPVCQHGVLHAVIGSVVVDRQVEVVHHQVLAIALELFQAVVQQSVFSADWLGRRLCVERLAVEELAALGGTSADAQLVGRALENLADFHINAFEEAKVGVNITMAAAVEIERNRRQTTLAAHKGFVFTLTFTGALGEIGASALVEQIGVAAGLALRAEKILVELSVVGAESFLASEGLAVFADSLRLDGAENQERN